MKTYKAKVKFATTESTNRKGTTIEHLQKDKGN